MRRPRSIRLCVSNKLVLTPTGSGKTDHIGEAVSLPGTIVLKEGLFEVRLTKAEYLQGCLHHDHQLCKYATGLTQSHRSVAPPPPTLWCPSQPCPPGTPWCASLTPVAQRPAASR